MIELEDSNENFYFICQIPEFSFKRSVNLIHHPESDQALILLHVEL